MDEERVQPVVTAEAAPPGRPIPPWWSPRRASLPLAVAVLVAAGSTAWGFQLSTQREAFESEAAERRERIADLQDTLAADARELREQQREVAREDQIGEDCVATAQAGVAFLHKVVESLGQLARFEESASQETQEEVNRLIGEANRAHRLCARGLT